MSAAITIRNLCVLAGKKNILTGLDFTVPAHSLMAVMGPMGGGKSTLLKVLTGTLSADEYRVSHSEARYLDQPLSARHHACLVAQSDRAANGSLADRLRDIEEKTCNNNDLLCIDEPTAGLTPQEGAIMMEVLAQLAKTRAVVMVSHNTREVRGYCDHVALIGGGRVVCALPVAEFFDMKTDAYAIHYICTGGLDLPDVETPIRLLAPENRATPDGFDTSPATGTHSWIIRDTLALDDLAGAPMPGHTVFCFGVSTLDIYSPQGKVVRRFAWASEAEKPDRNPPLTSEMCHALAAALANGERVILDINFNLTAISALLGAFLIMHGFAPAEALALTAAKLPSLHLGMRLEEFLWNIDLHLASELPD